MTDSVNNPLTKPADQAPAGLDSLLESVLSGEVEQSKERGRFKGACDGQGISLGMLKFGLKKKNKGWYLGPDSRDAIGIRNTVTE